MVFYLMGKKMAMMGAPKPSKYCQIYNLPPEFVPDAIRLTKVFEPAIGADLKFNLALAQKAAKDADLDVRTIINSDVRQQNGSSAHLFSTFTADLKSKYGMVLSPELAKKATEIFHNAFTNMHVEHQDAWIFWSKDTSKGTAYQYRTLYATTAKIDGRTVLTVTPLSLTASVNVVTERVLCHVSTTMTYDVRSEGLLVADTGGGSLIADAIRGLESLTGVSVSGVDVSAEDVEKVLRPFETAGYKLLEMMEVPGE